MQGERDREGREERCQVIPCAYLKHTYVAISVNLITRGVPGTDLGQVAHELAAVLEKLQRVLTEVQLLHAASRQATEHA